MADIHHDSQKQIFQVDLGSTEAYLKYRVLPSGDLDFVSTFVPDAGRGQGLAAQLVIAGLEYAAAQNVKVRPSCSYVAAFFEKHPEWKNLKLLE